MLETEPRAAVTTMTLCAFVGPAHVMVSVNDAWRARFGEPTLGVPVREAWTDPVWRPVQELMDRVYATGRPASIPWAEGTAYFTPITFLGQPGVGAALVPARSTRG